MKNKKSLKWGVFSKKNLDDKHRPINNLKELFKVTGYTKWDAGKHRMYYYFSENFSTHQYHCTDKETLLNHQ